MISSSLFPNFICRVGGLPTNIFDNLRTKDTYDKLKILFDLESIIAQKRELISELMFSEIQLVADNRDRNFLLNVKRDLYNSKTINHEKLNRVSNTISLNVYEHILNYQNLLIDKQKTEEDIKRSYSIETEIIRKNFKSHLKNSDFQKGLLISSNSLYKTQEFYFKSPNTQTNGRLEQTERGLLRYFSRMAMKATPFGTFCSIIPGDIILGSNNNKQSKFVFNGNPQVKESLLQINKGLYGNIIEHCKNRKEIREWFNLELNPTIRNDNSSLLFLTAQDGKEIFQKLPSNPVIELLTKELQKLSLTTYGNLIKLIAFNDNIDAEENEIEEYIDKLLEIGFIRFKIGISEQEVEWAEKLKIILFPIEDTHAKTIIALIELLIDKTNEFKNSDVRKRGEILYDLKETIESAFIRMEIKSNLITDLPFYEDATSNCDVKIDANENFDIIEQNLSKYINFTRKLAYPRFEQISMQHFFQIYYKDSRKEVPLLQFYEDFYREHYKEHLDKQQKIKASKYNNEIDDELRSYNTSNPFNLESIGTLQKASRDIQNLIAQKWIDNLKADEIKINYEELSNITKELPEIPKSHFSTSLFSQIILPSTAESELRLILPSGKYLLGYGKYFSRFLYLFNKDQQNKLYKANNESTDVIVAEICGDANFNANLHPPLVKWEISYPTSEGGLAEHEIKSTDLFVENTPNNNTTLKLKHKPSGKYIIPLDLGFLNPMMRPPLFQLLSKFSSPSTFSLPIPEQPFIWQHKILGKKEIEETKDAKTNGEINQENNANEKQKADNDPKIIYRPRIVFDDNIVVARKCWIISSKIFPAFQQNEEDYNYFIRINRWIKQHNIPAEVYIKITVLPIKRESLKDDDKNKTTNEKSSEETTEIKDIENNDKTTIENNYIENEEINKFKPNGIEAIKKEKQNKMSRDLNKPQYIDFRNPLLVNLFGKITVNLSNYTAYLEERYPLNETLPEFNGNKFTTEQIFQMNFHGNDMNEEM
ncbi:MAG: hypothetical protein COW71_05855 [Ignavibacteriales bacterium CG18_big_fil_WC_8_21_14_2_50_31_20]|nr:MAG: hypothetical protein COW71_05855 [Ignavibacteriales bacterium CG18_big_fil_WC_8_21_14_2_50_31_20]